MITLLFGVGLMCMWGCEAEEKAAVRCSLHQVVTGGAKSLSCSEVVKRWSGCVSPLPPPRTVPTLVGCW